VSRVIVGQLGNAVFICRV